MCIIIIKISSREDGQKKKVEEPARQSKPPAKKTSKNLIKINNKQNNICTVL